jgi:hypothetical protein
MAFEDDFPSCFLIKKADKGLFSDEFWSLLGCFRVLLAPKISKIVLFFEPLESSTKAATLELWVRRIRKD